jgi:hypothetical protein
MSELSWGAPRSILPHTLVESVPFAILATFVAINTLMYAALATAKILPRLHPTDWLPRRHQRAETRSIYPDAEI